MVTFFEEYQSRKEKWSDIQGHMEFLYEQAQKHVIIVELGVSHGNSTSALLAGVEKANGVYGENGASRVWSVDLEEQFPGWWKESRLWTFILGNDIHPNVLNQVPARIDMLFIDTSHTYAQTLSELVLYGTRMTAGGLICCHDALSPPPGVTNALRDFCELYGLSWKLLPDSYGLGIIELPLT